MLLRLADAPLLMVWSLTARSGVERVLMEGQAARRSTFSLLVKCGGREQTWVRALRRGYLPRRCFSTSCATDDPRLHDLFREEGLHSLYTLFESKGVDMVTFLRSKEEDLVALGIGEAEQRGKLLHVIAKTRGKSLEPHLQA